MPYWVLWGCLMPIKEKKSKAAVAKAAEASGKGKRKVTYSLNSEME